MKKVKVGIVGCGAISGAYFPAVKETFKDILELEACADMMPERAQKAAAERGCRALTVPQLLRDPTIEIVINLTVPKAHAEVAIKALKAGKSVYSEKPMAVTRRDGEKMMKLAREKGLLVGGAPDTFLGGGIQTCRKLIDDGAIGKPLGVVANMLCPGHEHWHPSPEFYYEAGGGPLFDMGPYYLTALVNLLGPVKSVSGTASITFPTRTISSEPKKGKVVTVETPTHICGVLEFANGVTGTLNQSFDVWMHSNPMLEVYGTDGSIAVPDPNGFGGTPRLCSRSMGWVWSDVPLTHMDKLGRGTGVADMALAMRTGRPARAGGDLCLHVLDIMQSFLDAPAKRRVIDLKTTCERPKALQPNGNADPAQVNWPEYLNI